MSPLLWFIPFLFLLSFAGLSYILLQAFESGAEAYSEEYSVATAREFEDIFLFIPPRRIVEASWAFAALIFLLTFFLVGDMGSSKGILRGLLVAAAVGGLGLRAPGLLVAWLRYRRLQRFDNQLVDALVSMSNSLKAGFSITQAFESVEQQGLNPIAQEFSVFLHETRIGLKFEDALSNMVRRVGSADLKLVVMSIETARITGGNLTEVFETIAATIRERMRIERRIKTLTAQGRMQGIVIGVMPLLLLGALMLIDPEMMIPFLKSTFGMVIMGLVAIMIFCGAMMIRKIIRIDI